MTKVSTRVLGINLGTTYSVTAILEGGKPIVLTNMEGDKTTPSLVSIDQDGKDLVMHPYAFDLSKPRLKDEYVSRSFKLIDEQEIGQWDIVSFMDPMLEPLIGAQ